jgi:hypothetical protein
MGYFIDAEGQYPRHAGDVQLVQPGWVEGVDPLPAGWVAVAEGVIPEIAEGFELVELAPADIGGELVRQFEVIESVS